MGILYQANRSPLVPLLARPQEGRLQVIDFIGEKDVYNDMGYGEPQVMDAAAVVKVLTPSSVVRAFASGFAPIVHASAWE